MLCPMTIDMCNFQYLIDLIEKANKDRLDTIKLSYIIQYMKKNINIL